MPNFCTLAVYFQLDNIHQRITSLKNIVYEIWMINSSNSGYFYMNYYIHIFLPLMHFYIKCITYDMSVIVEWRTARCGIHVRDTLSHYNLHLR
jgi:hypothetical protein